MSWLAGKRIVVTGGAGFLGKFVMSQLEKKGAGISLSREVRITTWYKEKP